jgi:thioredoxin 1
MDQTIQSLAHLTEFISTNPGVLIYFYNDSCAPCISIRPKVQALMDAEFPQMKLTFINSMEYPELPSAYGIFASPSLLVFFDGKESVRESKYIAIDDLQEKINRFYQLVFAV